MLCQSSFTVAVCVSGVSAAEQDEIKKKSVMERESVTLYSRLTNNPNTLITWYFNDTPIAGIPGDQSKICTDVHCDADERFKDRLELDRTGSLTITNIGTEDSGEYKLQISNSRFSIIRSFSVSAVSGAGGVPVSVKNGDSVTLLTGVKTEQQESIMWYFNDKTIVEITGYVSKICTNYWCKLRFRDRLKVDEFGSLTIMSIRAEDRDGFYKQIIGGRFVFSFSF
ncbi:uncharacterized protein LOC122327538 [Puntigrus tetrazona]|uniref:uncharacterized protein LOC122327538 n=1 Tax=Puntigrus tetrazona TaxID=1606681 RepID=UPI001C8AC50B|nr:uncharacterized protein LOC122327538 [Puntigrus tetrazona]